VGPAIGGILASQFGYVTPYLVASAAAAVVVVLTILFLEETVSDEERAFNREKKDDSMSLKAVFRNMPLVSVLAIGFGSQLAFSMLQATFSLFGEAVIFADNPEQTELGVGILLAMAGLGQISAQAFFVRRLVKWFGESPLIVIGGFLRGIPLFMMMIYPDPVFVGLALFIFSIGSGVQGPALQALATYTVDDSNRGGVLGVYQSSLSLSIIAGSAIAGLLFSITPETPFLIGGVIFMVMLIPSFMLVRWAQKQDFSGESASPVMMSSGD
jgi:predicted MFS family arabinose efflux permease